MMPSDIGNSRLVMMLLSIEALFDRVEL